MLDIEFLFIMLAAAYLKGKKDQIDATIKILEADGNHPKSQAGSVGALPGGRA